jgi:hypothetical protein
LTKEIDFMKPRKLFLTLVAFTALVGAQLPTTASVYAKRADRETRFTVRIENISSRGGQPAANGARWPFALSPGFWAVHEKEVRFFTEGQPAAPNGLEMQAEDGNSQGMVDFLMGHHRGMLHGVFNLPLGAETPGPIGPGGVYEFSFSAKPGMKLSLITMFGQSNDWFYAPEPGGIPLFDHGQPTSGDITSRFILWDAGTEANEEPGVGPNQAPRQAAPNTGAAENGKVRRAKGSAFYTKTAQLFRVTITPRN